MRQVSSLLSYWLYFPLAVAQLSQPLAWWFWAGAALFASAWERWTASASLGQADVPLCDSYHAGNPTFRKPSSYLGRSSGRYSPNTSLRLETRSAGSSWDSRVIAFCPCSSRPASA